MHASGIATVMFTDLEASTDTTTRLGDEAAARLFAAHDRIVREQLAAHGGRNVRSTGDGFLVLFDSARSAVACALAIQRELAAQRGRRCGCGSASTPARCRRARTARCSAPRSTSPRASWTAPRGGEILVTDTVRQLVGTHARRALPRPRPRRAQGLPRAPAPVRASQPAGGADSHPRPAAERSAHARAARSSPRRWPPSRVAVGGRRWSPPAATEAVDVLPEQRGHHRPRGGAGRRRRSRSACAPPSSPSPPARSGWATSATTR